MNLNKTMKHFGLAGNGVIVLLLLVVIYYLHLIEENISLERFSVGAGFGAAPGEAGHGHMGEGSASDQVIKAQRAHKVLTHNASADAIGGNSLQQNVAAAKTARAGATTMEEANQYRANHGSGTTAQLMAQANTEAIRSGKGAVFSTAMQQSAAHDGSGRQGAAEAVAQLHLGNPGR